jgi:hypothetical protein
VASLADTAGRLSALDEYAGFEVLHTVGPGWLRLPDLDLDEHLAGLVALHGRRNVAGSMFGAQLAEVVIGPSVSALVLESRCPDPAADNLALRLAEEGHVARVAVLSPAMAVLPGDPAAAEPHSVVLPSPEAVHAWWAERVAATLGPLLAGVRARAPFSLRHLWGSVGDDVTGTAIRIAQLAGRDAGPAWQLAERLLDALAPHLPVRPARGIPFPVRYTGGQRLFQVRGTCCLYYRSAEETGPPAERYCSTCPLRDDDSRLRHLREYLEETHPVAQ